MHHHALENERDHHTRSKSAASENGRLSVKFVRVELVYKIAHVALTQVRTQALSERMYPDIHFRPDPKPSSAGTENPKEAGPLPPDSEEPLPVCRHLKPPRRNPQGNPRGKIPRPRFSPDLDRAFLYQAFATLSPLTRRSNIRSVACVLKFTQRIPPREQNIFI